MADQCRGTTFLQGASMTPLPDAFVRLEKLRARIRERLADDEVPTMRCPVWIWGVAA
jgi:hypothetical protein